MAGRVSSPVFVGRQVELETIERALARATAGEAAHLLVSGEAGIGKTRFTAEAARIARERGFRVLRGECVNLGGSSLPYGPLVEALRGLIAELDDDEVAAIGGSAGTDLARLVPGFGPVETTTALQPEWVQSRLFEALLGFLSRLAQRSPVLLVIEDLHWADPATREAIAFLVRSLDAVPTVVVGTYRSDELHRRHPLLPWLGELGRSGRVERLELARLERSQLAALMAAILDAEPAADLVDDVFARSDGNPFFAEELLAAGRGEHAEQRLPPTLRDILVAHIGRVPESATPVLGAAAVAGRRVEHELLARVAGLPDPALIEGLRAAVAGNLLVVESEAGVERYAFRHALVQEVVYDDLLPGERRALHRAFAEALDALPSGIGTSAAGHWAEVAHHWAAARQDLPAFEASLKAADAAMSSFAFRAALHEYERALELWDGLVGAEDTAGFDRVELLRRAGQAAYLGADYRRAVTLRRQAAAAADPALDPIRAGILREELGRALWVYGHASAALDAYREAVAAIPPEPPTPERARVVSGLGQMLMLRARYEESRLLCEEAIAIAQAVGARAHEGHALATLGLDLATLGDSTRGIAAIREALRIARDVNSSDDIGRGYVNLSEALDESGETREARRVTTEGIETTDALGLTSSYGHYIRLNAAAYAYALGDWGEARRLLDEAVTRAPTGPGAELYRHTRSLPLLVGTGSHQAAAADLARAFELVGDNPDVQFIGPLSAASAELELWHHAPRAALERAEQGIERMAASEDRTESSNVSRFGAWAAGDLADEGRAARDERLVVEATERLARLRERLDRAPQLDTATGQGRILAADRATLAAEATRADGRSDAAAWHEVADTWIAVERPYLAAYARWREGEAALAAGDRAAAGKALQQARSLATALGARPLGEELDALARRARIRLAPDASAAPGATGAPEERSIEEQVPATGADRFGLTPREREVLALVADGRTNRQIAEALFISESTAGVHVSNILGKLGASSRGEAAAIAFRLRLVPAGPGITTPG